MAQTADNKDVKKVSVAVFDCTVVEKSIGKMVGIRVEIEENAEFFEAHTL